MNTNYNFCDHAPAGFGFCFKAGCAAAGECLRGLAARDLTTTPECIPVVNPLLADEAGGEACPFYRKASTVQVAYGFKQAMACVPSGRVKAVRAAICQEVCLRNYYYLLSGEKPLYPDVQQRIADILVRNGVPEPVEFDRYDRAYEWGQP